MALDTLVRQQKRTEVRAVATSPIFKEVLTGDNIPLIPSELPHQHGFHWSMVMVWGDMIGQGLRGLGLVQTLYISL